MPRRRPGSILPIEVSILAAGLEVQRRHGSFYGFSLAKEMAAGKSASALIAHGTLYKALGRLVDLGLLESTWEAPEAAEDENRPRRRLYTLSGAGEVVLARELAAIDAAATTTASARLGLA